MTRREFNALLGGAAATWPLAARAQQSDRVRRVGALMNLPADDQQAQLNMAAFQQGLQVLGWTIGRNLRLDHRWGPLDDERLRQRADELVALTPDVMLVAGGGAGQAVQRASRTVPVVLAQSIDPVGAGFVASLARPGGNVTGISFFAAELAAKRLGFLRDLLPKATRVALLVNQADAVRAESTVRDVEAAARLLGLQIHVLHASTSSEIDAAFESLASERCDALFLAPDAFFNSRRVQLAIMAARHVIPTTFGVRDYVEAGGLMSYGTSVTDSVRQVGIYAGRILKGAKPADLPVLQPTKFELVINLHTAKALGLTVPATLQATADAVIE